MTAIKYGNPDSFRLTQEALVSGSLYSVINDWRVSAERFPEVFSLEPDLADRLMTDGIDGLSRKEIMAIWHVDLYTRSLQDINSAPAEAYVEGTFILMRLKPEAAPAEIGFYGSKAWWLFRWVYLQFVLDSSKEGNE